MPDAEAPSAPSVRSRAAVAVGVALAVALTATLIVTTRDAGPGADDSAGLPTGQAAAVVVAGASATGTSGPHEVELSGPIADRVVAAARRAVPSGTVMRVETDAGGFYEVHLQRADGSIVTVQVGADGQVTRVVEGVDAAGGPS